jgi:adenylosuccinate lyase
VPAEDAEACRTKAPMVDEPFVEAVAERERTTDHDVAAFVDVVQGAIGMPAGSWIHYGLTSSDVVDTALCWAMRDAGRLLVEAISGLISTVVELADRHRDTVMIGRTHGIHAEPTTFGAKVALWALQLDRDRTRLRTATETVSVCKLSGAVGTYSNIDPAVEEFVAERLGLQPVPATQVIARDRHAELLSACASAAATCEMIAVELRHLQRTEVGEVLEGFKPGQKGSSAMPHKRNPISAETISGLARVVRSNLLAGLQDVALWHERDISHSSVERIILPDSTTLVHYCLHRLNRLLSNLNVNVDQMKSNLCASRGLVFSQPVLLALVAGGMSRDDAYRVVQRNAMRSWEEAADFRELLESDPDVALDSDALDGAFDLSRSLRNLDRVFDALRSL